MTPMGGALYPSRVNSEQNQEIEPEEAGSVAAETDATTAADSAGELASENGQLPEFGAETEPSLEETTENLAEAAGALGLQEDALEVADSIEDAEQGSDQMDAPVASTDGAEHSESSTSASPEASIDQADQADPNAELPEPEPKEEIPELSEEEAGMLGKVLFALLFASPEPLTMGRLKDLTESPAVHVRSGLDALEQQLADSELPLILRSIAGGFRLFSAPEVADVVTRLSKVRKAEQISPAALETLAIVAYRQPTTKAEVEAIRGVQAGPMLRGLIDRGLVKVTGRADQPGSPLQYGTTREFLDRFGLENLKALPRDNELAAK